MDWWFEIIINEKKQQMVHQKLVLAISSVVLLLDWFL